MTSPNSVDDDKIICPCLGVRAGDVKAAFDRGALTLSELKRDLKVATKCSGCEAFILDLLENSNRAVVKDRGTVRREPNLTRMIRKVKRFIKPATIPLTTAAIESPDLRTRFNIANLAFPERPAEIRSVHLDFELLSQAGRRVARRSYTIEPNHTLSIELRDLLPGSAPFAGTARMALKTNALGSLRCYCHWYNAACTTSTHEKYTNIPQRHGYPTLTKVMANPHYETYLWIGNLSAHRYEADIAVVGEERSGAAPRLSLAPYGCWFGPVSQLVPSVSSLFADRWGAIYFKNSTQPCMYYYFGRNSDRGSWQVQHL